MEITLHTGLHCILKLTFQFDEDGCRIFKNPAIIITPIRSSRSYQRLSDILDLQASVAVDGVLGVVLHSAPGASQPPNTTLHRRVVRRGTIQNYITELVHVADLRITYHQRLALRRWYHCTPK